MPTNQKQPRIVSPPVSQSSGKPRLRMLIGMALILVATCAAYFPAIHGQFLWDDDQHVTKPELRSMQGLFRIWFEAGATEQYYPLLHSAFWLEYQLWGDRPLGYHLVNLLLHCAAAGLVFLILRKLQIPGALAGHSHLRFAPGAGRIGGLDHRAEKYAVGRVLSGRNADLSAVRSNAQAVDCMRWRWGCSCWRC